MSVEESISVLSQCYKIVKARFFVKTMAKETWSFCCTKWK